MRSALRPVRRVTTWIGCSAAAADTAAGAADEGRRGMAECVEPPPNSVKILSWTISLLLGGRRSVRSATTAAFASPRPRATALHFVDVAVSSRRMMDTRTIGTLAVSVVGVGCNNFGTRIDADATRAVVDAALDAGVDFFDTADIYGDGKSEEFLGRALRGRRDRAVVATKFGHKNAGPLAGGRPETVRQAAEASLRRLGVERIDLYQMHQPDPSVPIDETLGALRELVDAGRVREIGCSNFSVEQIRDAERAAARVGVRFV